MNHDRILEISKEITNLLKVKIVRFYGNNGNIPRVEIQGAYGDFVAARFQDELIRAEKFLVSIVAEKKEKLIATLEAELKGEICPQPEPDPDAYLAPVVAAFGPHQGLNADWAVMAWPVKGDLNDDVFLLDEEGPRETVSLVTRREVGGDTEIHTITSGPVDRILPIALAIRQG